MYRLLRQNNHQEVSHIWRFTTCVDTLCVAPSRHSLSSPNHRTLTSFTGNKSTQRLRINSNIHPCRRSSLFHVQCNQHRSVIQQQHPFTWLCGLGVRQQGQVFRAVHRSQVVYSLGGTQYQCVTMTTSASRENSCESPPLSEEDQRMRQLLREIFLTAVENVMPQSMIEKKVHFDPGLSMLTVEDRSYHIQRNVFVVGFGKAVLGMARKVEDLLGDHIIKGILSIPKGARADYKKAGKEHLLLSEGSKICVQEGAANNMPDKDAYRASRDIYKLISNLTSKDIVIVLMSGGGSALLPYPVEPLDLEDILQTTQELFRLGASIGDVNTIRTHLEWLKGGGLAKAAMPAQVVSLIISDVIGDPLDLIASGPTVRQPYSPERCLEVIKRLKAHEFIPQKVLSLWEEARNQPQPQNQLSFDPRGGMVYHQKSYIKTTDWSRVHNVLVGSNAICCAAAVHCAHQLGFATCVLSEELSGEARQVGETFAMLAQYISACYLPSKSTTDKDLVMLELEIASRGIKKDKLNEISFMAAKAFDLKKPVCIVAGGETTVNIVGSGKGGRNQEMALAAGIQLQKGYKVYKGRKPNAEVFFLSAGTDGQDGPTEAAGALVDENFVLDAQQMGLDPEAFLQNNDSFSLWSQFAHSRDLVVTGLTGTNVMDIQLLVVKNS